METVALWYCNHDCARTTARMFNINYAERNVRWKTDGSVCCDRLGFRKEPCNHAKEPAANPVDSPEKKNKCINWKWFIDKANKNMYRLG